MKGVARKPSVGWSTPSSLLIGGRPNKERRVSLARGVINSYSLRHDGTSGVSKSDWIVETRATDYMCNSRDLFSKLDLVKNTPINLTASGKARPAGIGTVKVVDSNFRKR